MSTRTRTDFITRTMCRLLVVSFLSLLAVGASVGCASRSERFTLEAPRAVSTAYDVRNPTGAVELTVNPNVKSITVNATYETESAGVFGAKKAARSAMNDVNVFAETQAGEFGRTVTTITAERINESDAAVRLHITVPSCDGIRVHAAGEVILSGVRGAIQAETTRGPIDVRTDRPVRDPVALVAGDGNIYFTAPLHSQGTIDVQTPNGEARVRSQLAVVKSINAEPHRFRGVLAGGDNSIMLRTETGNAEILLIQDPMGHVRSFR